MPTTLGAHTKTQSAHTHRVHRPFWKHRITLSTLMLLVLLLPLAFTLVSRIRHPVVILDPVGVPRQFADAGFSTEMVTGRIKDRLQAIERTKETATAKEDLEESKFPLFDKVEIPDTGISLQTISDSLLSLLGKQPRHLAASISIVPSNATGQTCTEIWDKPVENAPSGSLVLYKPSDADPRRVADLVADHLMLQRNPYLLGVFLITEQNNPPEAKEVAQFMVSRPGRDNRYYATAHILLGYLAQHNANSEKALAQNAAETEYKTAINLDTSLPHPHVMLASVYEARGDHAQAIEELNTAIHLDRGHHYPDPHTNLATILEDQQGQMSRAMDQLREAIRIDPGRFEAYTNLGNLLCQTNRRAEGIAELWKGVQLAPYDSESHFDFGECLLKSDDTFDHGVDEMNWAGSLDPPHPEAYVEVARADVTRKRICDAIAYYNKAIAAASADPSWRKERDQLSPTGCSAPPVSPSRP